MTSLPKLPKVQIVGKFGHLEHLPMAAIGHRWPPMATIGDQWQPRLLKEDLRMPALLRYKPNGKLKVTLTGGMHMLMNEAATFIHHLKISTNISRFGL